MVLKVIWNKIYVAGLLSFQLFSSLILRLYNDFKLPVYPGTGTKVCGKWEFSVLLWSKLFTSSQTAQKEKIYNFWAKKFSLIYYMCKDKVCQYIRVCYCAPEQKIYSENWKMIDRQKDTHLRSQTHPSPLFKFQILIYCKKILEK